MALVEVATDPIVLGPDFDKSIQQIERIAGTVLKTSRTGVWLIDREHQVGLSSTYYDFEKGTHGNGTPKPLANFSTYLESLDVERYIDANDAQVDPRLAEWREFNRDANILSVLDASIRVEGNLVGAVCFEEIASKRMWTPSEMAFASMIADQTGLLILLNQLRKSEEAIRKLNEELEVRVQDRTLELKVRNEDLEFFSYTVSHDLRSPLRSMAGFSGILRTDYRDKLDDEGRTMLQRIDIATKRMAEMLDGILEYSRVGLSTSHYNLVNLNSIIERTVREVQQQMGAHKVAVEFDIESVEVSADTEGIAICIRNIVGNAFKFSSKSDHPKVSVTARLVNGNCEISIEDNGAGFDQQYSKKIFEMFNRLNPDIEIGSGIGLTIVSRVIQRMNGTIEVESEPGRGSKFTLTIPVDVTADRAAG
jgi:signal transduction histidine kinase